MYLVADAVITVFMSFGDKETGYTLITLSPPGNCLISLQPAFSEIQEKEVEGQNRNISENADKKLRIFQPFQTYPIISFKSTTRARGETRARVPKISWENGQHVLASATFTSESPV